MRLFSLDNRLSLCSSFVRSGKRICDVGTDHCYLPVFLVYTGVCPFAIATDINEGPLKSALDCVNRFSLSDKIDLRLCDGLAKVNQNEVDDIIIAGMGGELITSILNNSSIVKNKNINLILQPMTKYEVLIKYLYDNGFKIINQKACSDINKHYTVINAVYCGIKSNYTSLDCYKGKLDINNDESKLFLKQTLKYIKKKSIGEKSLEKIIIEIEELLK